MSPAQLALAAACVVALACIAQGRPLGQPPGGSAVPPGLGPLRRWTGKGDAVEVPAPPEEPPPRGAEQVETVGRVLSVRRHDARSFLLNCTSSIGGSVAVLVEFFRSDIVRVRLSWQDEEFDSEGKEIIVGIPDAELKAEMSDGKQGDTDFYVFESTAPGGVVLGATKDPFRLSLLSKDDSRLLWREAQGISRNGTATFQTLSANTDGGELFFGGGMQNGHFIHSGKAIRIGVDYNWDEGGSPNAVPLYMSSQGYGALRLTWRTGIYDFRGEPVLSHSEHRFDAFYFGSAPKDYKALLGAYIFLTGRPFLPPVYALGLGDSDCYHNFRHNNDTGVAEAVAQAYADADMPVGWMLINDGYGCGYGKGPEAFPTSLPALEQVSVKLAGSGIVTGLWSSTDFSNVASEVRDGNVRVLKTDVAWIGGGGKYAFDAVQECVGGIENNSDARRFIWTVEGWAGTHRNAVMWTGDNHGSWDFIRWQVPTFVGSGFSAQAHVSGDIDGIFGGSGETQVRDLQWKCFTTVLMSMGGWSVANPDKQPYAWGEPFTSINRRYLALKMRLTPYFYSLSREAYDSGVPPIRAMLMEFPEDWNVLTESVAGAQQFMAGPSFLVAPVYRPLSQSGGVREGIYLPSGLWVDYWSGKVLTGTQTLAAYPAPLDTLPVFVRAGAIVPMWPPMRTYADRAPNPLTLDVYPGGESAFELYEDDGTTRAFAAGAFSKTMITCSAPEQVMLLRDRVELIVGPTNGTFAGQIKDRTYVVHMHLPSAPSEVQLHALHGASDGTASMEAFKQYGSKAALEYAQQGWFWDRTYFYNPTMWGYSYNMWPNAFSNSGQMCSQAPEGTCPPWYGQRLTVKVRTTAAQGFKIVVPCDSACKAAQGASGQHQQDWSSPGELSAEGLPAAAAATAAALATTMRHQSHEWGKGSVDFESKAEALPVGVQQRAAGGLAASAVATTASSTSLLGAAAAGAAAVLCVQRLLQAGRRTAPALPHVRLNDYSDPEEAM